MAKYEVKQFEHKCTRLNQNVMVTLHSYIPKKQPTENISFDCDHKYKCGVYRDHSTMFGEMVWADCPLFQGFDIKIKL